MVMSLCVIGANMFFSSDDKSFMKEVFTVSEKALKERLKGVYDIGQYVEGKDYVRRKAFKGERVVFRKGILEELGLGEPASELPAESMETSVERHPVVVGSSGVFECKVERVYPNFRYAETTMGRVFLGLKGNSIKRGMIIRVKDNELYLKKV